MGAFKKEDPADSRWLHQPTLTILKKPGSVAVASAPWQADLPEARSEEPTNRVGGAEFRGFGFRVLALL